MSNSSGDRELEKKWLKAWVNNEPVEEELDQEMERRGLGWHGWKEKK